MGTVGTRLTSSFFSEQMGGRCQERKGQCRPVWIEFICGYITTNSRVQSSWRAVGVFSLFSSSCFLFVLVVVYKIPPVLYVLFNIIRPSVDPVSKCFHKGYGPGPEMDSGYLSCLLLLSCS